MNSMICTSLPDYCTRTKNACKHVPVLPQGNNVELIAQNLEDAEALKLQKPDSIERGRERIHQIQALTRWGVIWVGHHF